MVYSPNGLLVACGMGGETDGLSPYGERNKRHSPREEDGAVKIVSGGCGLQRQDTLCSLMDPCSFPYFRLDRCLFSLGFHAEIFSLGPGASPRHAVVSLVSCR